MCSRDDWPPYDGHDRRVRCYRLAKERTLRRTERMLDAIAAPTLDPVAVRHWDRLVGESEALRRRLGAR